MERLGDVLPRPSGRQVPRLAWAAARAWGPQRSQGWRGRCARVWAAFTMVTWWLPYLGGAHLDRRLAAVDESALAVFTVVGERRRRWWLFLLLFMIPAVIGPPVLLLAVGVAVPMLVGHPRAVVYTMWIAYLPLAALTIHMTLMVRVSNAALGGGRGWLRSHRGHLMISCLAAWPRRQGHAGRLARALGPVLARDGRPLVAAARTGELAQLYHRWADQYPGIRLVVAQAGTVTTDGAEGG